MGIEKMLVVSTTHVTEGVAQDLGLNAACLQPLIVYPHGEYGWLIVVAGSESIAGLPSCLFNCLDQALCEGCDWLLLDCDGPTHPSLETFEW